MANAAVVTSRQDIIERLWLHGESQAAIAAQTGTPLGTVKSDLTAIRKGYVANAGEVGRLARVRALAQWDDYAATAWRRVDALLAQEAPDEGQIGAYMVLIAKAYHHSAVIAGLTAQPEASTVVRRAADLPFTASVAQQERKQEYETALATASDPLADPLDRILAEGRLPYDALATATRRNGHSSARATRKTSKR